MMFADDLVMIGKSFEEVNSRQEEWKKCIEGIELRISIGKIIYRV